ncbi:hypothetical protein ACH414_26675 [Streptomyces sp. NPDC020422]|uniref:hypothetical protein n=1 Tax=Streptomyces sp. NPDC020422 TaxID=3365074 RepID=UPI0037BCB613
MVRTRLKLAATLTVVVLALTGFQTSSGGHGGGHGSGKSSGKSGKSKSGSSGSSGGGCSSSKKKNDDYDDYDGDGSGGSTATAGPTASGSAYPKGGVEVVVVDCVKPAQKKRKGKPARKADTTATLRIVTRDGWSAGTYVVTLEFKGRTGSAVDRVETRVAVGAEESKDFEVAMKNPRAVDQVRNCYVYDVRKQTADTPTPTPTASGSPSSSS